MVIISKYLHVLKTRKKEGIVITFTIDWENSKLIEFTSVVPNVRIPEREERRPPRQCNWQRGEVYYWLEPGPSATSDTVVQVREPRVQAVTQIYRVSTRCWFKWIGYNCAEQFHWSKLSRGQDFPGGFGPVPNFLNGKQWPVLSES